MITRRLLLSNMVLGSAAMALPQPLVAAAGEDPLIITDARGDYGLLAPYTHRINGPGYLYTSYIFDALLDQDAEGRVVPGLAEAWTVSKDLRIFELKLNGAARWHDGAPVTAEDVVFTAEYIKANPHPFVALDNLEAAKVLPDGRLRLTLRQPDAGFERNVLITMMILPRHIYEGQGVPAQFVDPAAATGSGPYRLAQYDKAQGRYLLEANADYYKGAPRFNRVAIVRLTPEAAIQASTTGQAHVLSDLPYTLLSQAKAAGLSVLTTPSGHPERLVFNHRGRFGRRVLRQAIAYAIDRSALVEIAYQGAALEALPGYFQPETPWVADTPPSDYAHDLAQAAALFEAAGWTKGQDGRWLEDGQPVTLKLVTDARYRRTAVVLAEQLEASGLGVELLLLELGALQELVQSDDFDLMLRTTSTVGDPGSVVNRVLAPSWNSDRYPDEDGRLRRLIEAQAATHDPADRKAILAEFQTLYAKELPALMLVNALWAVAHTDRVTPVFLPDGVASGIPMALHKSMFFRPGQ